MREVVAGTFGGHRLGRIMAANIPDDRPTSFIIDHLPEPLGTEDVPPTLWWVDTRQASPRWVAAGETVLHLLWSRPDRPTVVDVWSLGPGEPVEYEWAPGDFLLVPGGTPFRIGAGAVAVITGTRESLTEIGDCESASMGGPRFAPTHGLSVFDGFNRQTFGAATPTLAMTRWKLTHPQPLPLPAGRPAWLVNLVTPLTIAWPGGMEQLERLEPRILPPNLPITAFPNDLGYLLMVWKPDLEREVIPPLRSAGYPQGEFATLGIPAFNPE